MQTISPDLLSEISNFLSLFTIKQIALTCKSLNRTCHHDHLWRNKYKQDFPPKTIFDNYFTQYISSYRKTAFVQVYTHRYQSDQYTPYCYLRKLQSPHDYELTARYLIHSNSMIMFINRTHNTCWYSLNIHRHIYTFSSLYYALNQYNCGNHLNNTDKIIAFIIYDKRFCQVIINCFNNKLNDYQHKIHEKAIDFILPYSRQKVLSL